MPAMLQNLSLLLIMITLSSVAAQTFQYSRGWKNGKRDGTYHDLQSLEKISPCQIMTNSRCWKNGKRDGTHHDLQSLEKISPCQIQKLQYLLEGKVTESLLMLCDEDEPRRQKLKVAQDFYDNFQ